MSGEVILSMFLILMVMGIICFFVWTAGWHRGRVEILRVDLEDAYDTIEALEANESDLREENAVLKHRLEEEKRNTARVRSHLYTASEGEKAAKAELAVYKESLVA